MKSIYVVYSFGDSLDDVSVVSVSTDKSKADKSYKMTIETIKKSLSKEFEDSPVTVEEGTEETTIYAEFGETNYVREEKFEVPDDVNELDFVVVFDRADYSNSSVRLTDKDLTKYFKDLYEISNRQFGSDNVIGYINTDNTKYLHVNDYGDNSFSISTVKKYL